MASQQPRHSPEEIEHAATVMKESTEDSGGRLPTPFFYAVCETNPGATVEIVICDQVTDKVLMTQREQSDPYFPAGMWHIPGVMVAMEDMEGRYPDARANAAVRAIRELEGTMIMSLVPLDLWLSQPTRTSQRGPEMSFFYGAYLFESEPRVGQMFGADELPESMLDNHRDVIRRAPDALFDAHMSLRSV
jgi:hypothetical protein